MKVEIEENVISLTVPDGRGIRISYLKDEQSFMISTLDGVFEIGNLPMVTFCKSLIVIHNNLQQGDTVIQSHGRK